MLPDLLPPGLVPDGTGDAEAWQLIIEQLYTDSDLAARVAKAFADEPDVQDRFPTPLNPPADWFAPRDDVPANLKVSVLPTGQIIGRFFEWGECVIGATAPGECWTPPPSPTGYEDFHQSDVHATAADGSLVRIDVGMLVPGHSEPDASEEASIEHYNDPTLGRVFARAYEDEHGGYIVGSLVPWATYGDAALVAGSALSGHWTWRENMTVKGGAQVSGYDCLGPSMVVRPGLPLRRRVFEPTGEAYEIDAAMRAALVRAMRGRGLTPDRRKQITANAKKIPARIVGRVLTEKEDTMPVPEVTNPEVLAFTDPYGKTWVRQDSVDVKAHCAGRCGHCDTCRGDHTHGDTAVEAYTATPFDSDNETHVAVLDALVNAYGESVTVEDITGSTVRFVAEDQVWTADIESAEDGSIAIVGVEAFQEPEDEEASVTASTGVMEANDLARLDALEVKTAALEAMLAESLSAGIEASLLGPEEKTDQVKDAEED